MLIGRVSAFFARPVVAGITLTGDLKQGDRIHIKGHTTDITLTVESIQVENKPVAAARAGDSIGLKVPDRVRPGDGVYRVTEG